MIFHINTFNYKGAHGLLKKVSFQLKVQLEKIQLDCTIVSLFWCCIQMILIKYMVKAIFFENWKKTFEFYGFLCLHQYTLNKDRLNNQKHG